MAGLGRVDGEVDFAGEALVGADVAEGLAAGEGLGARDLDAKLVAGHAPITLEVTKEAVRRIRRTLSRDEGEDLILRAYMSEDFREGMDAFLNKRTPNWKGK